MLSNEQNHSEDQDETDGFNIMEQDFPSELDDHDATPILNHDHASEADIDRESNRNIKSRRQKQRDSNYNNINRDNRDHSRETFNGSNIQVVVRKRPINTKEKENNEIDIVEVVSNSDRVTIYEPKTKVDLTKYTQKHDFIFDSVFNEYSTNLQIYNKCVKPLLNTIFYNKGKATCFGYGQTGSGKTYTLLGTNNGIIKGLYIMAVYDIFKVLKNPQFNNNINVICSFYEIYGGKLFDLLSDRKQILCREDGKQKVNIVGLTKIKCIDSNELQNIIERGNRARSSGMTGANDNSSRSHAILSIDLIDIKKEKKNNIKPKFGRISNNNNNKSNKSSSSSLHGRISFIDLAGSERGADTASNNKQTRIEGAAINQSLLALKECIRALDQNHSHKPFRGSKLTQVLKESFMGNSKTVMIANISPNNGSCENTLNTLRYADRVKELKSQNSNQKRSKLTPPTSGDAYMPHIKGEPRSLSRNRSEPNLKPKIPHRPVSSISKQRKSNISRSRLNSRRSNKSRDSNRDSNRERARSPNIIKSSSSSSNSSNNSSDSSELNNHPSKMPNYSNRIPKPPSRHLNADNAHAAEHRDRLYSRRSRHSNNKLDDNDNNNNNNNNKPPRYPSSSANAAINSNNNNNMSDDDNNNDYNYKRHNKISKEKKSNLNQQHESNNQEFSKEQYQNNSNKNSIDLRSRIHSVNSGHGSELSTKHLIRMHRKHIDEFMLLIKEDMSLLKDFDKGTFTKDAYINKLKVLLRQEYEAIQRFQSTFR